MLNQEPIGRKDFHIACIEDTAGDRLIARWAMDEDRAYAVGRHRSGASLLALAALRALLFTVTRRTDWTVIRSAFGKPSVRCRGDQTERPVSLSHTGGLIAVAIGLDGAIGIDVERHRTRDFKALAGQAFGPAEQQEVETGGKAAFYRIWTLREAIAKATGDGLALVLNREDLADGVVDGQPSTRGLWTLQHSIPKPGCSLGTAWSGGDPDQVPGLVNLDALIDDLPITASARP